MQKSGALIQPFLKDLVNRGHYFKTNFMQLVTKEYLLEIIQRKASSTIRVYRKRFPHSMNLSIYPVATMEEVKEFVACIPYFDQSLKDFLLSSKDEQTIISQPGKTHVRRQPRQGGVQVVARVSRPVAEAAHAHLLDCPRQSAQVAVGLAHSQCM